MNFMPRDGVLLIIQAAWRRRHRSPKIKVRIVSLSLIVVAALLLPGCSAAPAPTSPPPVTVPVTEPAVGNRVGPSPAVQPVLAPTAAIAGVAPDVNSFGWDDRSPFSGGLVQSQKPMLAGLPDAPVYHIGITLTDSRDAVHGHETVQYTSQTGAPLDQIVFHLYPNLLGGSIAVENISLDGRPIAVWLDQQNTILRLPLANALAPNSRAVVGMDFDVRVHHDLQRNYGVFTFNRDILALAHFFPMVAEYDQSGWNVEIPSQIGDVTYTDASFHLVQIRAPAAPIIVGTGSLIGHQSNGTEQVLTFAAGPARDFYLTVSYDYLMISVTQGETTANSYAPAGLEDQARPVLTAAVAALNDYSSRFGPYPYTELDVVATSTLALGIEYPGIIAISLRVYDPKADFGATPVSVILESTVAHEVGHQWFYNQVGNDQLDEPWLDDSLVQYITWPYFAHSYGPSGADGFREALVSRWDNVQQAHMPIGLPVSAYTAAQYGAIVYGRGPLFFEALAQTMGQAALEAFLADYVRTFQWKIATTASLQRSPNSTVPVIWRRCSRPGSIRTAIIDNENK
jgi:hypothetical protein